MKIIEVHSGHAKPQLGTVNRDLASFLVGVGNFNVGVTNVEEAHWISIGGNVALTLDQVFSLIEEHGYLDSFYCLVKVTEALFYDVVEDRDGRSSLIRRKRRSVLARIKRTEKGAWDMFFSDDPKLVISGAFCLGL